MSTIAKARRVPPGRRALAVQAVALVWSFRAALAVLPFAWVRVVPLALLRVAPRRTGMRPLDDFTWAAELAGRRVPRATCLARALAVQALLALHGHPSVVQIGVARAPDGDLEAHAWVDAGTTVVVGGREATRFTPLAAARQARR